MKLTDKTCKSASPKERPYKIADGDGLFLLVKPNGTKCWRFKYVYLRKEKLLALGVYPTVTLSMARSEREKARRQLASGLDPSATKIETRKKAIAASKNTFRLVGNDWHAKQEVDWSTKHAANVMRILEENVYPYIGEREIDKIDAPDLLEEVLKRIEKRGAYYTSNRVKQICGQIFRYGIATRKCSRDPSADLKGALRTKKTEHFASLELKQMPRFLQTLEENEVRLFPRTRRAIKILMLTFTRTIELVSSQWSEFDLENGMWEIPAEKMKMRKPHLVPLSRQAIKLLQDQKKETGHLQTPFVFPGQVHTNRHMSNNTILFAIDSLGYGGQMTGHGFRSLAMSTIKERLGYRHEVVDRQLAHAPRSKTDRAYDRAQFLEQRITMMQDWADYMDEVAKGNIGGWSHETKGKIPPSIVESGILSAI